LAKREPEVFAKAARMQPNASINLYFGHGYNEAGNPDTAATDSVTNVRKQLGTLKRGNDGTAPLYGFFCCFAGTYHNTIAAGNRLANPWNITGQARTLDVIARFNATFASLKTSVEQMKGKTSGNVTVNLYFGADQRRLKGIRVDAASLARAMFSSKTVGEAYTKIWNNALKGLPKREFSYGMDPWKEPLPK